MLKNFYSGMLVICLICVLFALIGTINAYFSNPFSIEAFVFAMLWGLLTLVFLIISFKSARVGILLSFFSLIVLLRILNENHLSSIIAVSIGFFALVIEFFFVVYQNVKNFSASQSLAYGIPIDISRIEWHLIFVRMYIGYDLIAHCAEKLFSGPNAFEADVKSFVALGIANPKFFGILAGLVEFAGSISLGLGFLTRAGAIGTAIYLLIATIMGRHFQVGFTWGQPGGGWEYPVMWCLLILSFCIFGDAGRYSIDGVLCEKYTLPTWVKKLMGSPQKVTLGHVKA